MPNPVYQPVSGASGALPAGLEVEAKQQAGGAWRQDVTVHNAEAEKFQTEVVDVHGHIANVQAVTDSISGDEYGIVTNAIIHGKTTGGGGGWVDVKVTPSGALTTETTISSISLPTGASTYAAQTNGSQLAQIVSPTGTAANVTARTQTPVGNALQVQIGPADVVNNITPVVIDWEHHQVHEGETFRAQDQQTLVASGNVVKYSFTVPTGFDNYNAPHFLIDADVWNGSVLVDVYEAATVTGGSAMTAYNRNRNISATPASSCKTGVTSTTGTKLPCSFFAGAGQKTAASSRAATEWVMNNTTYRIDVTAKADATQCILSFDWYEDQGV